MVSVISNEEREMKTEEKRNYDVSFWFVGKATHYYLLRRGLSSALYHLDLISCELYDLSGTRVVSCAVPISLALLAKLIIILLPLPPHLLATWCPIKWCWCRLRESWLPWNLITMENWTAWIKCFKIRGINASVGKWNCWVVHCFSLLNRRFASFRCKKENWLLFLTLLQLIFWFRQVRLLLILLGSAGYPYLSNDGYLFKLMFVISVSLFHFHCINLRT